MELFIIRHAQSFNNAITHISQRVSDPELTEIAHEQARRLATHLATAERYEPVLGPNYLVMDTLKYEGYGITKLYCSAMWRALQTAQPVSAALNLDPEVWVDIHESGGIHANDEDGAPVGLPGKRRSEILASFPNYNLPSDVTEEGWWNGKTEDRAACDGRAVKVADKLREMAAAMPEERVAIITHAAFTDSLLKALFNQLPSRQMFYHHNNTAITRIVFHKNGSISLRYLNRVPHLTPELVT